MKQKYALNKRLILISKTAMQVSDKNIGSKIYIDVDVKQGESVLLELQSFYSNVGGKIK